MVTALDPFGEAEVHKESLQIAEPDVGVRAAMKNPQKDGPVHTTIMQEVTRGYPLPGGVRNLR